MKRQLVKSVTPRDYNNALLNLQALCDKDLNIEYNYAGLYSNMYTLAYYYNELARLLGAELSLRFSYTITHSSPVRICLTKDMSNLKDINAPLRISTMELEGFVSLLYGTYTELFNEYSEAMSDSNDELSGSTEVYNEMVTEYNDLLQQAVNAENVTQQDLADAIKSADEATREEAQATNTEASTPPEGTIGSGIVNTGASDEQDRGRQAAEDYARDRAAEAHTNELQQALDKANEEFDRAADTYSQALQDLQDAKDDLAAAEKAADVAGAVLQGATVATGMEMAGTLPSNPGEFQTVKTGYITTTVTKNDDGGYTMTVTRPGEAPVSRDYPDGAFTPTGADASTSQATLDALQESRDASVAKAAAADVLEEAKSYVNEVRDEYNSKAQEVVNAEQAVNEDSIPSATPDELDSWDNSGGSTEGVAETSEDVVNDFDFNEDTEDDNE